jgi:ATP-dependent helicase HrpA
VLSAELGRLGGVTVPPDAFDLEKLPPHLRLTFNVVDDDGQVLATGKDLDALREQVRPRLRAVLADAAAGLTRTGITSWDFDSLPREFAHGQVLAYPALAEAGGGAWSVDVRLFETRAEAEESMLAGNRRLLLIEVPSGARAVAGRLPASAKLAMSRHPYPSAGALIDDCAAATADEIIRATGGPAWDAGAFAGLLEAARSRLRIETADVVGVVAKVLAESHSVEVRLDGAKSAAFEQVAGDLRSQLDGLIYPGFVSRTGARRLPDLIRYLRAMWYRMDKAPHDLRRDAERMATVHRVTEDYELVLGQLGRSARGRADVLAVRWMIEELRVSLFAQPIGAAIPVSEQRIQAALDRLL